MLHVRSFSNFTLREDESGARGGRGGADHLDGRAQGYSDCEVHLVLHSDKDRGDVLAGIAGYGQDDEPQEPLVQPRFLAHVLDSTGQ